MSARGDRIGDRVAAALNSPPLDLTSGTLAQRKQRIWRAICNALELEFELRWIEITVDPTVSPGIVQGDDDPDPGQPWPKETCAWQLDGAGGDIVAAWFNWHGGATTWRKLWGDGVALSTKIPLPDGIGSAGNTASRRAAAEDHVHPALLPPEVSGAYLYATRLAQPAVRTAARFVFRGAWGCTTGMLFDGWTLIAPGTWQAPLSGRTNFASGMCDDVTPADGDRFMAWATELSTGQWKYSGLYQVLDCGVHPGEHEGEIVTTQPVVRRTEDANTSAEYDLGLYVQVTEGLVNAGKWFHLLTAAPITLDTTSLSWERLDTFTPATTKQLLTYAQMLAQSVDTTTIDDNFSVTGAEQSVLAFPTLDTAGCGLTELPAGTHYFQVARASLDSLMYTGDVKLKGRAYKWTTDPDVRTTLFEETSQPFRSLSGVTVRWPSHQARIALAPTDNLGWEVLVENGTGETVIASLRWNSGATGGNAGGMGTFWQTTAQFASTGGTNWHPDLLGRHEKNQHADTDIEATAFADATVESGVIIKMPVAANGAVMANARFRYPGGGTFNGIDPTGFVAGHPVCVFFDVHAGESLTLGHNQTPPDGYSTAARFLLKTSPSGGRRLTAPTFVEFRLDTWSTPQGWREQ